MRKAGVVTNKGDAALAPQPDLGVIRKIAKIGSSSFAGYLDYRNIWRDAFWI